MIYRAENDKGMGFCIGDRIGLTVDIEQAPKIGYELADDDVLTLYVYRSPSPRSELLIEKSSEPGSNIIQIEPEDTEGLEPGNYCAVITLRKEDEEGPGYVIWPPIDMNDWVNKDPHRVRGNMILCRGGGA